MKILIEEETVKQALEALENYTEVVSSVNDPNRWTPEVKDEGKPAREAITALRTELKKDYDATSDHRLMENAQGDLERIEQAQSQEPVAVARVDDLERGGRVRALAMGLGLDAPLYTSPPLRQPLTDEQIDNIWHNSNPTNFEARSFARAIEAKIKGEA